MIHRYKCFKLRQGDFMLATLLSMLDQMIYFFGFAPDLKIRIAFISLLIQSIAVGSVFLYLTYIIIFKKNFNFLQKESITNV